MTDDIEESLEKEWNIFHFKSKGILIASSSVEELDRDRYRLTFKDADIEGILDGGHNILALGRHILGDALEQSHGADESEKILRPIKRWEDLRKAWNGHSKEIEDGKPNLKQTLVPIEIIFPAEDSTNSAEYFEEMVLSINAARNNNAQLTEETKANKKGFYDPIKNSVDPSLKDFVEWKTNDGGRIKVRDLVAQSLIPLSCLKDLDGADQITDNPSVIFSSKGQCVEAYNRIMNQEDVAPVKKGGIVEVEHEGVVSALALMKDIPMLFDHLYSALPGAYNAAGGKFGKIDSVKGETGGKATFKTPFYKQPTEYRFGEGFIYPLVYALKALIKNNDGKVEWRTDPRVFLEKNLVDIMKSYISLIQGMNYDPAKVGKNKGAYNLAVDLFSAAYKSEFLKEAGYED